jgi:hypothetical protein
MRIDAPIFTGSFSLNGSTLQDLSSVSTTGSNAFVGNQTIQGFVSASAFTGSINYTNLTSVPTLVSGGAQVIDILTSINSATASFSPRITNLESKSASVDISVSNINSFTSSNANTSLNSFSASNGNTSLNSLTGSYATTGSNTFFGTQTFSGSVYIANNLIVQGSSSIQYISASSVSIGTNIVQLNTANPSVRFAGLSIIDSGSIGGSGSFLYDSVQDEFIFVHRGNGTNVTSSHFVTGPETYDSLGNETYLTCNIITKGTGKEHLVDSCIFDNGTTTCIKNNLIGTGTACFGSSITGASILSNTWIGAQGVRFDSAPAIQGVYLGNSGTTCTDYATIEMVGGTIGGSEIDFTYPSADYVGRIGYNNACNQMWFVTNSTERIRISNTGISCFQNTICTPLIVAPTIRAAYIGNDNVDGNSAVCFGAGASDNTRTTVVIKDSWNGTNNNNAYIALNVGTGAGKVEALKVCSGGNIGVTCSLFGYNNMRPADNGYGGIDFYNSGKGYAYAAKIYTFKGPSEYYGLTTDYGNATAQFSIVSCGSGTNNISFFTGTSNAERMVIGSTGLVGIGVICACYNLHVKTSTLAEIGVETTATDNASRLRLINGDRSFFITNNASDDLLSMYYDGTNRLQFNTTNQWFNSGCLGVNTATPSVQLHVNGLIWAAKGGTTNNIPAFQVRTGGGGPRIQTYGLDADCRAWMGLGTDMAGNPYEHSVYFSAPDTGPYGRVTFGAYDGTTYSLKMTIARDGSIGAPSGTNIYNPSDCRLKTNISPITQGLNQIMCLNPVKFNWIDGYVNEEKDKTMLGFLAQEMNEVLPEVVEEFSDGTPIKVGDNEIYNPLRVNEKFIIPVLVKAIQELKAEIEELKNK